MKDSAMEDSAKESTPRESVGGGNTGKRGRPITVGGVELVGVRLARKQYEHCLSRAGSRRQIPDYLRELIDRDMEPKEKVN